MNYEQMDTWSIGKNEPKRTQFKPNSKPIQTQFKPNFRANIMLPLPVWIGKRGGKLFLMAKIESDVIIIAVD
jgi:hypothetical protein